MSTPWKDLSEKEKNQQRGWKWVNGQIQPVGTPPSMADKDKAAKNRGETDKNGINRIDRQRPRRPSR